MNKGQLLEKKYSEKFHREGIPILASSLLLREIRAGQIDVAIKCHNRSLIYIYEIKHHDNLSNFQKKRLKLSSEFLGTVLNCNVLSKLVVDSQNYVNL